MGELSIKIRIGDREYPMKIEAEEEEQIRKAGRMVNEQLRRYKDRFGTNDKQDLLAMVAFDAFMEKIDYERTLSDMEERVSDKLGNLNKLISRALTPERSV
ncbi:cell division protein ZapA [Catalinimonas alkaloidigena]|uniref:cell division protein ZapA n=1 Tax=Catalinimonas alkaloidigena TaxID=1075417 RepID=UPI00240539BC|nr:cell division protein ZapA [Catalinimonas alkaloidigena]MDF9800358.1 cell division protein ZapA [Catalinimonas alkaloidigena]